MKFLRLAILLAGGLCAFEARATLGLFEHGAGIKSLGYGGVSYVGIDETTALTANPAAAVELGSRFDIGSDVLVINSQTRISGNAAGPDGNYDSDGRHVFSIPQVGLSFALPHRWAVGVAAEAAGFGPDYTQSPYARFASPAQASSAASSELSLKIAGISLVAAKEIFHRQSLGLGFNIQHQSLTLRGVSPFEVLSEEPDAETDVGKHGSLGLGATAGWSGIITPWLRGALSYRSQTWSQRIDGYRGILPDQGRLNLPAIYGGGLQAVPLTHWQVALEFQRFAYGDSHAFGNPTTSAFEGHALGSSNGPGFGWQNQNVYKLGVQYQPIQRLELRAGFIYATEIIARSQTLLTPLAPGTSQIHYTGGATWSFGRGFEISGYGAYAPFKTVYGEKSIPAALGGGEVDVGFSGLSFGLTFGQRFGKRIE